MANEPKKLFSSIAKTSVSVLAGAALILAPATAAMADHHEDGADSADQGCSGDAGDKGCSGDAGDKSCSGDKDCSGDKECSGDKGCSGDKDCSGEHADDHGHES